MKIWVENGKIMFSFDDDQPARPVREGKGKSRMMAVGEFVAVDLETTGLSPEYDDIIEVAAVIYTNGEKSASYSSLVNPGREIDEFVTEITGITNEMLEDQPPIEAVLPDFIRFIGDRYVVGHNVNFDINFIYDACEKCGLPLFSNDFIDTLRLSRVFHKDYKNHRLDTVVKNLNLPDRDLHRAENDADLAAKIYLTLIREPDFEEKISQVGKRHDLKARDITAKDGFINEDSPFFGKVCVFTGALEAFTRREAFQLIADIGGVPADNVTKKTNFLILGNNDYCPTIRDGKSNKQKAAEKLIAGGADLQILPESLFIDMLADDLPQ